MTRIRAALAAAAAAALTIGLSGAAAASTAATRHQAVCIVDGVPDPSTEHVIPKGATLAGWDARHGTYAANTLGSTAMCAGGWQSLALLNYVNAGNWHARFRRAVTVWTFPWHK